VQVTGFEPVHAPAVHASVWVQTLPSLQAAPSAAIGFEHTPVEGLQTPTTWHWSLAVHVTGLDPAQTPAAHASLWVQALPSLQLEPFAAAGFEQVPVAALHTPAT